MPRNPLNPGKTNKMLPKNNEILHFLTIRSDPIDKLKTKPEEFLRADGAFQGQTISEF